LIAALIIGADIPEFTLEYTSVFLYICIASISGYTLWYYILKNNSLSKMFIVKFAELFFFCLYFRCCFA